MGFQTPQFLLTDILQKTTSGQIQLPDFQREYKWDDERIRSLLATVINGHPMGVVMLLQTGGYHVRFKPKPLEGSGVPPGTKPEHLLLDGQQRLTSLTQALTGDGIVNTKDSRGKLLRRRYYVDMAKALLGEDWVDEAVISLPEDGVIRTNFNRDVVLDVSTAEKEQERALFPLRLLCDPWQAMVWLNGVGDQMRVAFQAKILTQVSAYKIPAIELDSATQKAAVATVFEKVNTGGLTLNVFELLTAMFAGDREYYEQHGTDFRLNDDWQQSKERFAVHPVLGEVQSIDFIEATSLLTSWRRSQEPESHVAVTARREDLLKLSLADYLAAVEQLRNAFVWASTYLADQHIFDVRFLPYQKQLVPLAVIRAILGKDADLHSVRARIDQWFWCGIMGELYGGAIATRFARDIQEVPAWARGVEGAPTPRTVLDCSFAQSRLLTLRTRNAAAYKGLYTLLLRDGARDWMYDHDLGKVQYADLAVDIHHVFPYRWCVNNGIEPAARESILNKTPIGMSTNRAIGGGAPASYLRIIERTAGLPPERVDALLRTHHLDPEAMRNTDFDAHFDYRAEQLVRLVEHATGRPVQRDLDSWLQDTNLNGYDPTDPAVIADEPTEEDIDGTDKP